LRSDIAADLAYKQAEVSLSVSGSGQSLYPAMGWIHFHHGRDLAAAAEDFARAQRGGLKAAAFNPIPPHQNVVTRAAYSSWNVVYQVRFALARGLFSDAIALLQSALAFDPYSPVLHARLAWAHHLADDSSAAVEQARVTQTLFPDHSGAQFFCSIVFAAAAESGDDKAELALQATALATRLVQHTPTLDAAYANLAYAQARQGHIIEARALLDRQQQLGRERFVMRSFHAPALVELGEFDAAMEALLTADRQHCSWLFELLQDPRLQALRGEPEFERLCRPAREMVAASSSVA
jgi:tetratricopeptide (TPR) repeat protein